MKFTLQSWPCLSAVKTIQRFKTSFITTFLNWLLRKSFSLKINVLGPSAHPRLENGFVQSTQVNEHIVFSSPGGHLGFSFVIIPCFSLKMTNYCLILTLITSTMNAVGSSFSHPLNSIVLAPQKPPDSATLIKDKALIRLFQNHLCHSLPCKFGSL